MILDIVPVVRELAPHLLTSPRPTVACVCTTRAKFLVFDGDAGQPACVVDVGDRMRLCRVSQVLSALQQQVPGLAPRTVACVPWREDVYVHVQQGLPGIPWFRLADTCRSESDWRHVLRRAVGVMFCLHDSVARFPEWRGAVDVRTELMRQFYLAQRGSAQLSGQVASRVLEWTRRFGVSERLPSVRQHGDFSLNNLLFAPAAVHVIDFDEFGSTLMPLHDAFGLALSVALSQGSRCPLSRAECIDICTGPSLTNGRIRPDHVPALLLHHLLWRINDCHGLDRRQALQEILTGWVEELAAAPDTFLRAS